jgi:hypothetical protein
VFPSTSSPPPPSPPSATVRPHRFFDIPGVVYSLALFLFLRSNLIRVLDAGLQDGALPRLCSALAFTATTATPASPALARLALLRASLVGHFVVLVLGSHFREWSGMQRNHLLCRKGLGRSSFVELILVRLVLLAFGGAWRGDCDWPCLLDGMNLLALFDEERNLSGDAGIGINQD